MINSYDEVIVEKVINNKEYGTNTPIIIMRFFNDLLKAVIQRMKKEFCWENYKKIFTFFRSAFGLTYQYYSNNDKIDMN
jgi:hypothetical protein